MKKWFDSFGCAIPAGVMIGIGGAAYCLSGNAYIGALLFCVGLYLICISPFYLITGKIGFVPKEHLGQYFADMSAILAGNIFGTLLCAGLVRLANPAIIDKTSAIVTARTAQSDWQTYASGILCGILVHLSVCDYKYRKSPLGIFICIPTFILCGFEHSVADMFYFFAAKSIGVLPAIHIATVLCANAIGAIATNMSLSRS